jgi:erythromycin esterase
MTDPNRPARSSGRSRRWLLGQAGAATLALSAAPLLPPPTQATSSASVSPTTGPGDDPARWVTHHAQPLRTVDPAADLDDLTSLRETSSQAAILGLGQDTDGAREVYLLMHRVTRYLVEEAGYRLLTMEEDWTKGVQIDDYLTTGTGSPETVLADAGTIWQTEEIADLLRWLRAHNQAHPNDPVRFAGADVVAVRPLAYDAVSAYAHRAAPGRAGELDRLVAALRPAGDMAIHVGWYLGMPDRRPILDDARRLESLVAALPRQAGYDVARQYARVIRGFYEYFFAQDVAVRDQYMAANVLWARRSVAVGVQTIYWAATAHVAVGPHITLNYPPFPRSTHDNAGSMLRRRLGAGYRSMAVTFDHGQVNVGYQPVRAYPVAPPSSPFVDATLAAPGFDYLLDLRAPASPATRAWLTGPATMRLIGPTYDPARDADYNITGGALAGWFDLIVHRKLVQPTRRLSAG